MRATWYVLEDGTAVDPNEVLADENGVLTHSSGAVVAIGDHGNPRSTGVDIDANSGKQLFAGKGDPDKNGSTGGAAPPAPTTASGSNRQMKPAKPKPARAKKPYKTRETKAG